MEDFRFIKSLKNESETELEATIRPQKMSDYIGQEKIKANLKVYIEAAKLRGEPLDHVLLYGPPGLGKTTMAGIIAQEMGSSMRVTSGPVIERAGDLAAILSNNPDKSVIFIDEIHRLNRATEEILYPAMEDFALDFVNGKGPAARNFRLKVPRFTLIGATTRAGMLTGPLRDRFGIILRLELYTPEELNLIVNRSADILKIDIDKDAGYEIARRSRGTPRIANRLLKRVSDFAVVDGLKKINIDVTKKALALMDIDELGLDFTDERILETIIDKFNGGPVGLETLATASGEESNTIEDVYEPYLIQLGFIARTPRGRVCLEGAYKHLNKPYYKEMQLF